jgi:uncharacterized protein (TIGR03000 family)
MKRMLTLGALAIGLCLAGSDTAQAQRWGWGPSRGGVSVNAPGFSYNYGNPGWYGYNYGYPYGGWYGRGNYYAPNTSWGYGPSYGYNRYPIYYYPPAGSNYSQSASGYAGNEYATNNSNQIMSFYQGNPGQAQTTLQVRVPDPNAQVTIDNQPTAQRGTDRVFAVPQLEAGKTYSYTVRATWMDGAREVSREKKIEFKAGEPLTVNFMDEQQQSADTRQNKNAIRPVAERRDALTDRVTTPEQTTGTAVSGKIVRIDGRQMVVKPSDGGQERTFQIADDAAITRNGNKVTLQQLATDMSVTVTPGSGSPTIATKIEVREGAEGGAIIP